MQINEREETKSVIHLERVTIIEITATNAEELWFLYQHGYVKVHEMTKSQFERLYGTHTTGGIEK